ncbi:MAG TPA: hypothetical protein PLP33_14610 [Leptospiraceae bacterium]|nr:hypothetical protein [Leptospiraceae bacterium]
MENTTVPTMISLGDWLIPLEGICKLIKYSEKRSIWFKKPVEKFYIEVFYNCSCDVSSEIFVYNDYKQREDEYFDLYEKLVKAGLVFGEMINEENEESSQECQETQEVEAPKGNTVGV